MLLEPRAVASYRLSFGASLLAATVNSVFGFIIAWTLVRYEFPGRKLDRRADRHAVRAADGGVGHRAHRPCSRRTAGSASTSSRSASRSPTRWIGVVVALTLIGLPFVVRTVQPALLEVQRDLEDAAETLGAGALHDLPPHHPADGAAGAR